MVLNSHGYKHVRISLPSTSILSISKVKAFPLKNHVLSAKMTERKYVLVEIVSGDGKFEDQDDFEVEYLSGNKKTDLEEIVSCLKMKSKFVEQTLMQNTFVFKKESVRTTGKWCVIGDRSPVQNNSVIKCVLKQAHHGSYSGTIQEVNDGPSTSCHNQQSSGSSSWPTSITGDDHMLSELGFLDSTSTFTESVENASMVMPIMPSLLPEVVPRGANQSTAKGKGKSLKQNGKISQIPSNYKLPTHFSISLDEKLENPDEIFWENETAQILRELAKSIQVYTYHPTTEDLSFVIRLMLEKFPHFVKQKNESVENSVKLMMYLLRRKIERKRESVDSQHARKIRRIQPIIENNKTPGALKEIPPDLDLVSYESNVQEMLKVFKQGNQDAEVIKVLMEITFQERKIEIQAGKMPIGVFLYAEKRCPFLRQESYLLFELDMLLGKNTCRDFRQAWIETVPLIVAIAKKRKTKMVYHLFNLGRFQRIDTDFEARSTFALEMIAILLPGKQKGAKARRYFVDHRDETANLVDAASEIGERGCPFILSIGTALHIVVDNKPFLEAATATEAVLLLMATYYVFNLQYSPMVDTCLHFLQVQCLKLPDDTVKKYSSVTTFLAMLQRMKESIGGQ